MAKIYQPHTIYEWCKYFKDDHKNANWSGRNAHNENENNVILILSCHS